LVSPDLSELDVIGCDGAAVNTGHKGGIMCLIEQVVGKPLQHGTARGYLTQRALSPASGAGTRQAVEGGGMEGGGQPGWLRGDNSAGGTLRRTAVWTVLAEGSRENPREYARHSRPGQSYYLN